VVGFVIHSRDARVENGEFVPVVKVRIQGKKTRVFQVGSKHFVETDGVE
jgi:hypothetical protein